VVVARVTGGTARVLQAARRGDDLEVQRTASADVSPDDEGGARAIVNALDRAGIRDRRVVLCLSGRTVLLRRVVLPPASPEQIPQLIAYEAQRHLPLPVDQLATAYEVLPPRAGTTDQDVLLAVTRRTELTRLERALQSAGLRAEGYCSAPLAVADAWLGEMDRPTAACWLLVAPDENGVVAQVVQGKQPVLTRYLPANGDGWAADLRRSLAAFQIQHPDAPISEALLAGGLDAPAAVGALGLPCRSAGRAAFSAGGESLSEEWAALVGAARQSLGVGGFPLLIEPQARVGQVRNQERSRAAAITVAALGVAVLLGVWQFDRQQRGTADAAASGNVARQVIADRKLLGVLTKRRDLLREQWSTVGGDALQGALPPLELLRRAASTAPAGIWLTEMTAEAGEPLRLVGTSRDEASVSRWLRSLERAPGFASVELGFVRSGTVDATQVTQFRIDCTLATPNGGAVSEELARGLPRDPK